MNLELHTFTWKGTTRYCCPNCSFDGATQQIVVRHWAESHKPKEDTVGPTLFDADDKPITRRIYVPGDILPGIDASGPRGTSDPA